MRLRDFSKVTFGDGMRITSVKFMLLPALFLIASAPAEAAGPVVVELFTSQNCSTCPPADKILGDIAHNPDNGLIVLGCHVTYWDHMRWKDTLSLPACTERQRDYAGILEQGRNYTPNMVVNGVSSFDGSQAFDLDLAVRKARQKNEVALIDVAMTEKGFEITLPDLPAGQRIPYELNVLTYKTNQTVEITAGENRGKTILYSHAVSDIKRLPPWQGEAETRLIQTHELNGDRLHGVVVIAQPVRGGKIRAAGEYRIYFN
jgi:hypothetical protein